MQQVEPDRSIVVAIGAGVDIPTLLKDIGDDPEGIEIVIVPPGRSQQAQPDSERDENEQVPITQFMGVGQEISPGVLPGCLAHRQPGDAPGRLVRLHGDGDEL